MKQRIHIVFVLVLFPLLAGAQFISVPPIQDGIVLAFEYGSHLDGLNKQTTASGTWYCTWDANNIYFAITGSNLAEGAVLYLDVDPEVPVNGGGVTKGSVAWMFDYDATKFHHPIRSDFGVYIKDSYNEFRYADGAGDWTVQTSGAIPTGSSAASNTLEFRIPWNTVTSGNGRPSEFNWFGYKVYNNGPGSNGTYAPVPVGNTTSPNNAGAGALNDIYPTLYYSIVNTDNLTATPPFAAKSFTYHEDVSTSGSGGYYIGSETYFDLTVYDGSTDNTDNDPANDLYDNMETANRVLIGGDVTLNRNLVVGEGSALLPADNNPSPVNSSITLNGSSAILFNEGRIDCTPEVGFIGDHLNRRLSLEINGTVEYQASTLFKDRSRFSDITLHVGSSFVGPSSGSAEVELQYGTLTNYGILDFYNGTGNSLTFDTRGDSPTKNDYFLSSPDSSGVFILNGLLVGRDSSSIRPAANGGVVTLEIHGDFENYHEFVAKENGGQIDVIMKGDGRQEIKGDITQTVNQQTEFFNLVIDNDNGLSDNNTSADVHFVSSGGGELDYVVKGSLELKSGDLVTRDRITNTLSHRLLIDSGAVVIDAAASGDIGAAPSSFIDGPLSMVGASLADTLGFPVGKGSSIRNMEVLTFRPLYSRDTTVAELFLGSAGDLGYSISNDPEAILNISQVHWWNAQITDPTLYDSLKVMVEYSDDGEGDWVSDPNGLRLLATGPGTMEWKNVTPFRGSMMTAPGAGYFVSDTISVLGDFTFGNVGINPLPVELLRFDAEKQGDEVYLDWTTATEVNSSHFEIYRYSEGSPEEMIGRVTSVGNSSSEVDYSLIDAAPSRGWNYYRLRQFDHDGTYEDLATDAVFYTSTTVQLAPNPFNEQARLSLGGDWQDGSYRIIDGLGRVLEKGIIWSDELEIGHDLRPGKYLLILQKNQFQEVLPLVKNPID